MNSEQRGERRRRRALRRGVMLGVVGVLFFFCSFPCLEPFYASKFPDLVSRLHPTVSRFDPPPQPFDSAKWQRGYATDRIAIAKSLTANGALVSMSRDQVKAMLGTPDLESGTQLRWELGNLDTGQLLYYRKLLVVHTDGTGAVVKVELQSTD